MSEKSETVTTQLRCSPPKYQATIPENAREILDIEEKTAILDAELTVRKVTDEDNGGAE